MRKRLNFSIIVLLIVSFVLATNCDIDLTSYKTAILHCLETNNVNWEEFNKVVTVKQIPEEAILEPLPPTDKIRLLQLINGCTAVYDVFNNYVVLMPFFNLIEDEDQQSGYFEN